jgi:type III pantothenate kinase
MLLAIDIGNTNIVLGGIENGKIRFEARMATDRIKTADQYCAELKNILALFEVVPGDIEGSIISSVVPLVQQIMVRAVERLTGLPCLTVGPGLKTGLNIKIDNPAQAGSDLIVGSVAAIAAYGTPLCVIDLGTATTISVIDKSGAFRGGTIAPGVMLTLNALSSGTAQLPAISLDRPRCAVGTNTVDSMRSGLLFGTASMLDGMVQRIEEELGYPTKVVATGGLAKFIVPLCRREMVIDDSLLLRGLELIFRRNVR